MLRIQKIIVDGLRTTNFNCATSYLHILATYIAGTCPSPELRGMFAHFDTLLFASNIEVSKTGGTCKSSIFFSDFPLQTIFLGGGFPICGNFHRATRTYRSWISIPGRFTASFSTPNRWPDTFPDGKTWVLGGRPLVNLLSIYQRIKICDMYVDVCRVCR